MNKLHYLFLSFVMVLASACYDGSSEATVSMADGIQTVTAFAETEPVPDDDDAAPLGSSLARRSAKTSGGTGVMSGSDSINRSHSSCIACSNSASVEMAWIWRL